MTKKAIYPFDIAIIAYMMLLSGLILIFGRPLSGYYDELLINAAVVILVILIVQFLNHSGNRLVLFFRILYPGLLFTLFYEQTGGLMKLIFPDFLDRQLIAFESTIFGIDPSLWLDKNVINVWLTEILSFCYFSYYTMLPIFLLGMFLLKRYDIIKPALTAICLTFFISYFLFLLYPIEGPRWYLAGQYTHAITGTIFRPLVDIAINKGAVHGGCMPSSHVAVALVMMYYTVRAYPKTAFFLVTINIGLALGTVYGRFHYVSDVVVGAIIGTAMIYLTMKYYHRFDRTILRNENIKKEAISYVS